VTSSLAPILSWSRRHRTLVAVATIALVLASLGGMQRLTFDTDVLSLLPRDGRVIPAFRSFLASFGSLDQLYIVFSAPAGQSIADYDDEVDAWIDALRRAPEIARVDSGTVDTSRDFEWLADRQLLLLGDPALRRALARFSEAGMTPAIADRRSLLAVPSPGIAQLVRQDPLGLFDLMREQLGGSQAGLNIGITEGGYLTSDGRRRLVIAQPKRPPYDAEFSRALFSRLEAIRTAIAARPHEAEPGDDTRAAVTVEFAGGHRIAIETEALVRRESISNTVGSLALILPLLFLVFRSPWLVAVGSLPSAISLLLVLGVLGVAGATLSAAATASAAMLFGLGVDGVVLLYVAYTRALDQGLAPDAAIDGLTGSSYSMLLGMWTTAATFYGLVFVDFPSLEQLGRLIGHSMVLCGLLTLVLVPATLPRTRGRRPARSLTMPGLAAWVQRHRVPILAGAALVTLALGLAATRLRINPTLDRLKSVSPAAALQEQLAPMFGLPGEVYVVLDEGPDLQARLSSNERVMSALAGRFPGLSRQPATALLPSQATQSRRAAIVAASGLSTAGVAAALTRAAGDTGFRPDSFDPFRARVPRLLDGSARLTFDAYHAHGLGDLLDRFIVKTPHGWLIASYIFPSSDAQAAAIGETIREVEPNATLTGLPLVNRELAERFLPQFVRGLAIGTIIVVAIVVWAFRDWWLSVLALLPTAIGLVWAAGLLALAGTELDLFALFAVVTFVGIGVDYGIHLVQRYRERGEAAPAIEELAPVILVAAAITVLGYGTLITSSYPPLRSIGIVSAVSVAALSIASVVVLPALLTNRPSAALRVESDR
jgi:predicted exporter